MKFFNLGNQAKSNLVIFGVFIILLVAVFSPLVSAGILDYFKSKLTGEATTQVVGLNISVGNNAPAIPFVETVSGQTITEYSTTSVTFTYYVDDADGTSNINTASLRANFTNGTTGGVRGNSSCISLGTINTTRINVSCTIDLWYWDNPGTWNISVYGEDSSAASAQNISTTFSVGETPHIVAYPGNLTFPGSIVPGSTNTGSDNDPLTLNNTGNKQIPQNGTEVNATHLVGEQTSSEALYAGNFSVYITDTCGVQNMSAAVFTNITNSILPSGNLSSGGGTAQEQLYVCLTLAGSEISSQAYSTGGPSSTGPWTVRIQ